MKNLGIIAFGIVFLLLLDGFVDGNEGPMRKGRRKVRGRLTTPGLVQGVYNAASTALQAILSIPGIIWHSIFHHPPRVLLTIAAAPKREDGILALSRAIRLENQKVLYDFSNLLVDPNLTKVQLNEKINQLKEESPGFKTQMDAIEASEEKDYNNLISKVQSYPELSQLMEEIKALHENQQIGFGEETLKIMEKLANTEDSQKSQLCQIVHELTKGQSQFTTEGLASIAAACQTLNPTNDTKTEDSESSESSNFSESSESD